ncbi:hypothetical protein PMAYCL1PPCAC_09536 [Pristionchus mayeri]|uniref:DNA2/NAM7 helicase-like C-terminal domain-containing protein n=1 Tax=Pristionchus mayeri TaxID=1317129 RepID=A0AAN4ZHU2_9BILA|nr:hypothetical protein PMAYCL1PPCAC_09536 [Pristionchus mayeri]
MTAAAMAVSYKGEGVQLFLSTANVPVINMALALAKLDYGSLRVIHLISSEREDLMTEETRSPFSVLSLAKERESLREKIEPLEEQLKYAPNEEKEKIKKAITKMCGQIFNETYDIYFGTVDMMLGRLYKNNQGGKHQIDSIKKQLKTSVRRIVVDEASQLTEAALNALILCFPKAQIVLIGDSKQLPPFRFTPEDVVSSLAARPALDVAKDKMNLPVIKLTHVYRASKALIAHYSEVFYRGSLLSFKAETYKNPLSCFGARSKGSRCLFWKVAKGVAKKHGTSKFNRGEIQTLRYIVNILRNSGYDSKSVMIISYYEAQRKKAEDELKKAKLSDYELLTVDSAQGREKKVVIVLTTRTSVPVDAGAFFNCALRCNVAVSRHQEALIVIGHPSIAAAPNWARVLSSKYFRPVEDGKK